MTVTLSLFAGVGAQFLDNNGLPLSGGKIYTYTAGSTTPLTTYTSNLGTVAQSNPIILNASGRISTGELWLTNGYGYKFVVEDANGVLIGTYDNVPSSAQPPITNDASSIYYEPGTVTTAGSFIIGETYLITFIGSTNFQLIGASSNTIGIHFVATGVGSGTGTAEISKVLQTVLRNNLTTSVKDFGAIGDGTTDDTASIQSAINYTTSIGGQLNFPVGIYLITSPILVYVASTFISCSLIGANASLKNNTGVIIDHSSILNAPALIIQGARSVTVDSINFIGPNNFSFPSNFLVTSNFLVPGVRDSQYSPQCGICVDPFNSTLPSDDGYPTLTSYYNSSALFSSNVVIRNCFFNYQVVGICYSPNEVANNDENGLLENINFYTCKTAIALCEIQSKGMSFTALYGNIINTFIDTFTYGARNGSAGFSWVSGDVSSITALIRTESTFSANEGITQNWKIQGVYCENIYSIGWVGLDPTTISTGGVYPGVSSYNNIPGYFDSCTFWFALDAVHQADAELTAFAPIYFVNCVFYKQVNIYGYFGLLRFYFAVQDTTQRNSLQFNNCHFSATSNIVFNNSAMPYVYMHGCTGVSPNFRASYDEKYKINNMSELTYYQPIWPCSTIYNNSNGNILQVAQNMNNYSLGNINVTVGANSSATFTAPDATTLLVGDIIYTASQSLATINNSTFTAANWPLGVVYTTSGTSITLVEISESATSTTEYLTLQWYPYLHSSSTVTTVSGSTNIVITPSGDAGTDWQANTRIISTNISGGAYVVSGTAPNYVISKAATASASGIRCYDANCELITTTAF